MTELPFLVVSDCAYWSRDAKTKWEECGGGGGVAGNNNGVREQRGNDAGPGWKPTVIIGGSRAVTDQPASKLDLKSWQM